MSYEEERRAAGMQRVPVQALVEICGRDVGGAPAFEAESVDVSGRGMHLRTAYLPEIGSPLVCRFENGGNEIVVEGAVAWRREQDKGGEFGIKFTALDSGSVEALKDLCKIAAAEDTAAAQGSEEESAAPAGAGSRVRLHIDGLGSPMKACIRNGSTRKVQVASNLEFLKMGRHLEIEDVGVGERRGAQIDGVDVVIDPETRVPQLVVALRYDGAEDDTPEPSVIDSEAGVPTRAAGAAGFAATAASTEGDEPLAEDDFVDGAEMAEEAAAMRGKVANMAVEAGSAAKKGGAAFAKFGGAAAVGIGKFFKGAGAKVMEMKAKKSGEAPRRTTAVAPSVRGSMGAKLRPQSAPRDESPAESPVDPMLKKRRVKKIAALSALGVLLLTVGVIAMKKPSAPPGADKSKDAPASVAVAAAQDVTKVDEQGNPIDDKKGKPSGAPGANGANADVPLFGPTPMATMEPAPLGAAPQGDEGGGDGEEAKSEEAKEKAAASAAVDDQAFGDAEGGDGDDKSESTDGSSWGNGKLHDPVVYRLRLDKAGTKVQGAVNATGFTVMLPGVKVMESPNAIMQRDSRVARVKTKNSTSGAEISFQFKDGIPGYKVRVKKDSVEFFLSSADKGDKGAEKTAAGGKKKGGKKTASLANKHAGKKPPPAKKQAKAPGKPHAKKKGAKKKAG